MTRRLLQTAALLAAIAGGGCIDYQESIDVHADGTVDISIYATVTRGGLKLVENRPELQQLLLLPPNPAVARQLMPDSVRIKHWVIREGPGIRIYDMAVTLTSLESAQIELGALAGSDGVRIYRDGDSIVYRRRLPAVPIQAAIGRKSVEDALKNSRLEFRLSVPTHIIESNGIQPTPQQAVWRTDLLRLRQTGVEMVARVQPPRPPLLPWLLASAAVTLALVALWWRRRRQRRFDAAPPIG